MVVCIAVFELFKEEFYFLKGENWACHLLFGKLNFEVCFLLLPFLDLCANDINSFACFNRSDEIRRGFIVFFEQLIMMYGDNEVVTTSISR